MLHRWFLAGSSLHQMQVQAPAEAGTGVVMSYNPVYVMHDSEPARMHAS